MSSVSLSLWGRHKRETEDFTATAKFITKNSELKLTQLSFTSE